MKRQAVIFMLLGGLVAAAAGQTNIGITSFHGNGNITWTSDATNVSYRVEWASQAAGHWSHSWNSLDGIAAGTNLSMSASVPMFYRVVDCTHEYMVIDLSEGPVEQVSYNDIRGTLAGTNRPASGSVDMNSFMGLLRAKTGQDFDLPTEAQWEQACRAGTTSALNSGFDLTNTASDVHMDASGAVLVQRRVGIQRLWRHKRGFRKGWLLSAERVGLVRHARERVGVVFGLVRNLSRNCE